MWRGRSLFENRVDEWLPDLCWFYPWNRTSIVFREGSGGVHGISRHQVYAVHYDASVGMELVGVMREESIHAHEREHGVGAIAIAVQQLAYCGEDVPCDVAAIHRMVMGLTKVVESRTWARVP